MSDSTGQNAGHPTGQNMGQSAEAARWHRLKDILGEALELPATGRQAFLLGRAADAAELAELQALLDAGQGDDGLLDAGPGAFMLEAVGARLNADWVGRQVGPYRLVGLIARGGMGQVYEAERAQEPNGPRVAIKLMREGLADEALAQRFIDEGQTLAKLDHPNLARLLDAGVADGVPYIVMELVAGESIDAYCAGHGLGLEDRLSLFRTLCAVVHHAHLQGVVHRDLKPANVLVTAQGVVKLVDFGIAKNLQDNLQPGTATAMRVMTLACASPEQVLGQPVTPASDVYALGVLLYGLLTGQSPYGDAVGNDLALRNMICNTRPVAPSRAVHGAARKRLRAGMDAVVLAALRKDPRRRYASAQALSDDVARFLEGRAVHARWAWARRAVRLLRRRRVLAGVAVAAGVVLAGSVAVAAHALVQARQQAARAQLHLAAAFDGAVAAIDAQESMQELPGSAAVRHQIVADSLAQLERLRPEAQGQPALAIRLAQAYVRVAQAQGGVGRFNLGDMQGAGRSFGAALALFEHAVQASPGDRGLLMAQLGLVDAGGGMALWLAQQGRMGEALPLARQGLERALALAGANPDPGPHADAGGLPVHLALAQARLCLVRLLDPALSSSFPTDSAQEMSALLREAGDALQALRQHHPADARVARALADYHALQASHLLRADVEAPQSAAQAAAEFRRSLALTESVLTESTSSGAQAAVPPGADGPPAGGRSDFELSVGRLGLGDALTKSRQTQAGLDAGAQALEGAMRLWRLDPGNPTLQWLLADAAESLSRWRLAAGDAPGAAQAASQAVDALAAPQRIGQAGVDPAQGPESPAATRQRIGHLKLGALLHARGQALLALASSRPQDQDDTIPAEWLSACDDYRASLALLSPLAPRHSGDTVVPEATRLIEMRQVMQTCPVR